MTRQLLIATSVALALSVTACGRNDDRADASRTAPGANTATSPASAIPPAPDQSGATGGTSGMGAGGTASSPDTSAKSSDSTTGMGTNPQIDTAAQPYGSQSSVPPSGTPSSDAGSTSR